jgi:alanyl-tRNA synthetase
VKAVLPQVSVVLKQTGAGALAWFYESEQTTCHYCAIVKGNRQNTSDKVQQLAERNRELEKEIDKLNDN